MSDTTGTTAEPAQPSFEFGHMTFVEMTADPRTGKLPSAHRRARETIEQARLADQVGLDLFAVGEHHRTDFVGSAPAMVLAAAAEATENIRLTSSVTVLGSEDPVRVWEQFATLDQFSGGRAEIITGRGSYTESFPLFGYDLADYADLFREKLDLLLKIRADNPLTWSGGRFRPPLQASDIGPRAFQAELPIWVGVGGTVASAIGTGRLGLPMAMALLTGHITQHRQTLDMYRAAAEEAGHDPATLRTSINLHGYIGSTSQGARDTMYPYFARVGPRGLCRELDHDRAAGGQGRTQRTDGEDDRGVPGRDDADHSPGLGMGVEVASGGDFGGTAGVLHPGARGGVPQPLRGLADLPPRLVPEPAVLPGEHRRDRGHPGLEGVGQAIDGTGAHRTGPTPRCGRERLGRCLHGGPGIRLAGVVEGADDRARRRVDRLADPVVLRPLAADPLSGGVLVVLRHGVCLSSSGRHQPARTHR
ncbi:hypothetical protein SRB5_00370 [Streptomyces sp. RB5]|uniref:Luciferase-like domain-containing protein n=1 Tax=Streptomyces smaragdinus TaxID=2585196 RepID=A0A7K0CAX8_9ACTN|nr:hypothetical protein [Streptomyces smaragdinus]